MLLFLAAYIFLVFASNFSLLAYSHMQPETPFLITYGFLVFAEFSVFALLYFLPRFLGTKYSIPTNTLELINERHQIQLIS